ncbi:MAG: restriction endonuclease [archaeon]|nr:restriction endonuclease [archaeon]MCP8313557.1 restriction endonuclease [archaeon]MCP8317070.1 restriction endonuclease [archaeon]
MPLVEWERYSEPEIHAIISYFFGSQGYNVRNLHQLDRAKERGADLILSRPAESERIAVQIKKKPKGSDTEQLRRLSERSEKVKKYIYVQEPTEDFAEMMEQYKSRVDFWDGKKLCREIIKDNPYLGLLLSISSTQTAQILSFVQAMLIRKWREMENKKLEEISLPKPDEEFLHLLWQAKDRAVAFGKGFMLLANAFDSTDRKSPALETRDLDYTVLSFVRLIDDPYIDLAHSLCEFFQKIFKRYVEYVEYACVERRIGTEWLELAKFHFLAPGTVVRVIDIWQQEDAEINEAIKSLPPSELTMAHYTIFDAIHNLSRDLALLGDGIEGIIDDMWRYVIDLLLPSSG